MKKTYVKPEVMVENFVLSDYIASCDPSFGNNMNLDNWINDIKGFFGLFTWIWVVYHSAIIPRQMLSFHHNNCR